MKHSVHWSDVGFDSTAVVQANTEEEVLQQVAVHAQEVFGVAVTPKLSSTN